MYVAMGPFTARTSFALGSDDANKHLQESLGSTTTVD